ncbi:hypothetical protein [Hymenobacter metallicola]|uniref:Uncharacterized protein n=1 Tax=Hymenobacter metallicola TaxID=2563114 RepID=A0A4Z0Q3A7_9BACT|nr:hypothetical protein [Hymenobacter metallicola]TGE23571.1 hypothetical protein E5K02_20520 [Hymenobacter metallicola]
MKQNPEAQSTEREPRISVNKLADYLATPSTTKRRSILREQKFPKESEFKTTYYNEAKQPIKKCFTTSEFELSAVNKMINKLRNEIIDLIANPPETADQQGKHKIKIQRKESCLEALEIFLDNTTILDQYKEHKFTNNIYTNWIEINGVKISVEPDIIITGHKRKKPYTGAIKLYFSKSNKITKDMGKTISSMLYEHIKEFSNDADNKHCFVYDVINTTIYSASTSYTTKIKEIQAACEDISAIWPTIQRK